MFKVGQKVICVEEGFPPDTLWIRFVMWLWPFDAPTDGAIYTVANVIPAAGRHPVCLELVELPSPATEHWAAGFIASGFRPVVSRPTSIEVFTRMLGPKERAFDLCSND